MEKSFVEIEFTFVAIMKDNLYIFQMMITVMMELKLCKNNIHKIMWKIKRSIMRLMVTAWIKMKQTKTVLKLDQAAL